MPACGAIDRHQKKRGKSKGGAARAVPSSPSSRMTRPVRPAITRLPPPVGRQGSGRGERDIHGRCDTSRRSRRDRSALGCSDRCDLLTRGLGRRARGQRRPASFLAGDCRASPPSEPGRASVRTSRRPPRKRRGGGQPERRRRRNGGRHGAGLPREPGRMAAHAADAIRRSQSRGPLRGEPRLWRNAAGGRSRPRRRRRPGRRRCHHLSQGRRLSSPRGGARPRRPRGCRRLRQRGRHRWNHRGSRLFAR